MKKQLLKKIQDQKETIKKINLRQQWLEEVPDMLKFCHQVEEIDLTGNYLFELPDWLFEFPKLKALHLALNDMESIPRALANAQHLEKLSIDAPVEGPISDVVASLTNLRKLDIVDKIHGFPAGFFDLPYLEELNLHSPAISSLPEDLSKLPNLRSFSLSQIASVYDLDEEQKAVPLDAEQFVVVLSKCSNLRKLDLSGSGMHIIPKNINKLQQLTALHLNTNGISILPEALFELKGLETLDLGTNSIGHLPKEIKLLTNLRNLLLNSNHTPPIVLTNLFNSIQDLTHLQKLALWSCQTKMEIPEMLSEWTSLRELDLDNNKIKTLPKSIKQMTWLKKLRISTNPIPKKEMEEIVEALKDTQVTAF